jgi:GGDEF domain-containing protein
VTISAGASAHPLHGGTRDEVVKAADAALYSAKQAGRNCVRMAVMASQPVPVGV